MTGVVRDGDRTVWVMQRDEQMLEWFAIVRVANMQTLRWVLGALNGWDVPVTLRRAQGWCGERFVIGARWAASWGSRRRPTTVGTRSTSKAWAAPP